MTIAAPTRSTVEPTAVKGQPNGDVDISLLQAVDNHTGKIWMLAELPARGMRALHAAAKKEIGLILDSTGRGRTYATQYTVFMQRYTTTYIGGVSTKSFQGKTWYLKPGNAMAAVPGTSPHGKWCADDTAKFNPANPSIPLALSGADLQWMYANTPKYGFYYSATNKPSDFETWHLQWGMGDTVPQAVLDYESNLITPPITPPVPPISTNPEDDEMSLTIFKCTDADAAFIALTAKAPIGGNPLAIQVSWLRTIERYNAYVAFGVPVVTVATTDLKPCDLSGPIPSGDRYPWVKTNFNSVAIQA